MNDDTWDEPWDGAYNDAPDAEREWMMPPSVGDGSEQFDRILQYLDDDDRPYVRFTGRWMRIADFAGTLHAWCHAAGLGDDLSTHVVKTFVDNVGHVKH
ncbi:hypothetical protein [Haloglycomyces albus]|uniref:hypothetical protein n=1 Tax=Haloglycomyces albus TaxID=526067 RepID=UPI00046CFB80|nr:hypothetical protein [Haloglycomyces albus]